MKKLEQINAEISELKERVENVQGRKCTIYTRIVGYYRPLKNWNIGKREEYNKRVVFKPEVRKNV